MSSEVDNKPKNIPRLEVVPARQSDMNSAENYGNTISHSASRERLLNCNTPSLPKMRKICNEINDSTAKINYGGSARRSVQVMTESSHKPLIMAQKSKQGIQCKYECEKCKSKFINRFLLSRHNCSSTTIPKTIKIAPKLLGTMKINTKNVTNGENKPFEHFTPKLNNEACPAKNSTFALKISPKPLSENGQNTTEPPAPHTPKTSILKYDKQCDKCALQFNTYGDWFDHQVLKHGFKTPDKKIGEVKKKKLVKTGVTYSGIPAQPAVAKSLSRLMSKVRQLQ